MLDLLYSVFPANDPPRVKVRRLYGDILVLACHQILCAMTFMEYVFWTLNEFLAE